MTKVNNSNVQNRFASTARNYVKYRTQKAAINFGKKAVKAGGKLLGKALQRVGQALLQAALKAILLLFAKLGLFFVIVLILITLAMAFAFSYKAEFKNFVNDETKENNIGLVTSSGDASEIPKQFLSYYQDAAANYNVDWWILAAIHKTETSFSSNVATSSAGAIGHMQFMPTTWYGAGNIDPPNYDPEVITSHRGFGVDANGDNVADPYNIQDAISSAANYLNHDHYRDSPLDALALYGHSKSYAEKVMSLGKAYSGQNSSGFGLLDNISQWWQDFSLLSMSNENTNMLQRYKSLSDKSVTIVDKFEQETAYRTPWGLLAALDTSNQMINETNSFTPELWEQKLRPNFTYRDSIKTTEVIVTTKTRKTEKSSGTTYYENRKVLTQANTFAGVFTHHYKKQVTTDTQSSTERDTITIVTTTITQEVPSFTQVAPDFSRLISLINSQNFDGNDFKTILELADTFEAGRVDLDTLDEDSFWNVAYNQYEGNNILNNGATGALPGSIGTGEMGTFTTWPVSCASRISSGYGWRFHPILLQKRFHSGIDISGPNGSYQIKDQPIYAVNPGKVIFSGWMNGYGNVAIIDHGNGVSSFYAHMRSLPIVSLGEHVTAGQTVGYVGTTGRSSGEHLHFEIRVNGVPRNPLDWEFRGVLPNNLDTYQN